MGPVFVGSYSMASYGNIKYEVSYLFCVTSSTPRGTLRWKFEHEISFQVSRSDP